MENTNWSEVSDEELEDGVANGENGAAGEYVDRLYEELKETKSALKEAQVLLEKQKDGICYRFLEWQNDMADMGPAPRKCGKCWACKVNAYFKEVK
jgi:hypothetical protein